MPTKNSDTYLRAISAKLADINLQFEEQGQSSTLKEFTRLVRLLINAHTCILTFINLNEKKVLKIAFSSENQGFEEYLEKRKEIPLTDDRRIGVSFEIASRGLPYETTTLQTDGGGIANPEIAKVYGLTYSYCHPVKIDNLLKGYLNFFSNERHPFSKRTKLFIGIISKFAEIPIHQYEHQYEIEISHNLNLKEAIDEMAIVKGDNKRDKILKIALKYSKKLLGKDKILSSILKLDDTTGKLVEVEADPPADLDFRTVEFGKGYCSQALIEGKVLLKDIKSPDWKNTYIPAWGQNIQTEMVIPLMIKNERVHIGTGTKSAFRPIGVLNFESQHLNVFTQKDIDILSPLVSQASVLIEKFAIERKLSGLRETEKKLINKDWKETLSIIASEVRNVLGFELVNISLVDYQRNTINTEVVIGLDEETTEKFLEMASHSLDSNDIQASIVKSKKIEVPGEDDERFDKKIWTEFKHENIIRVFVPIISPLTSKCVGTIDAGYKKGHREYIYESDIQILQGFAELSVEAIEKRRANLIDKVFHELQSPIGGIEGHADVLRNTLHKLYPYQIQTKLEDIELDCEILRRNIEEMRYFLGKSLQPKKIEKVHIMNEVVIKTIKQLRSRIKARKLLPDNITYDMSKTGEIVIFTDIVKLNQVVYNLLVNAIRYAEKKAPDKFKIEIVTAQDEKFFIIRILDWGIGVEEDFKDKIFEDYFRTPKAERHHMGTGLGLPISRKIMRDVDGDVVLISHYKPTEFQIKIPKRYRTRPKGFSR